MNIGITKAQLAIEVLELLAERGLISRDDISRDGLYLDVQDIFSNYWDEKEL